ncbi:MAG TPA: UDP-N-acetylglucosamine 4,6-dehydratase (inverting) [Candidatus Acidoferrales bacterium]|nr:UDP-N-acetylglucosamine 4,6-dehydratase (inverting) [Candidatus Acidoferrales bacterium]
MHELITKAMNWSKKTVLVTGGTGSFGREFASLMLAEFQPKKLIIFSRDEMKQYTMRADGFDAPNLRYFIGDVRDKERLYRAFYGVDIVVHAAAMKQVPTAEYNPFEAIKTNVIGAANVIDAAIDCGVEKVIALSTDKAAHPINLYGASKLCSDKLFVAGNAYSGARKTRMSVVRYGNVAGSRGSVIPFFWEQRKVGVLTITDRRMTRFWITLDQGARFVAQCLEQMHGGEIFVPKIPSMRICDLAEVIAPACRVNVIGIRPGEKLHEIMVPRDDARHTVELPDFYVIQPDFQWWDAKNWKAGRPCEDGFRYSSDTNSQWLTRAEMQSIIAGLRLDGYSEAGQNGNSLRAVAAAR